MAARSDAPKIALCIGHPGHELHVHGWLTRNRPTAFVLTDGSGADRVSRLPSTTSILQRAGAEPGNIYGAFSDRQFYEMILRGDPQPFIDLARRLADGWIDAGITAVAGDMLEGFNTTHDLCRMLINAACEYCRASGRKQIANFEFPLEGLIRRPAIPTDIALNLTDDAFAAKRSAANHYPEILSEVDRLVDQYGEAPFRREVLQAAGGPAGLEWTSENPPFYETYGAKQVAAGHYREVITFSDHVRPIAHALWSWAGKGGH